MAQEVGKLYRVKKQVQGVVPSAQNSEYFEPINIGGGGTGNVDQSAVINNYKEETKFKINDILMIEEEIDDNILFGAKAPIPPYYIQFAKDDGNFDENEEPSNWYKKQYGIDTEWGIKFNGDSVAFITEGQYSNDGRNSGIQEDAIRNITGRVYIHYWGIGGASGVFYPENSSDKITTQGSGKGYSHFYIDASQVVPVAQVNRMRNRLIRVYKLTKVELTANYYLGQFAIPPFYTVYPESDGTFDDTKRPTNFYKNLYGVNTVWELIHNDGSFFRSIGGPSDNRSNGVQGDAIRNITGEFKTSTNITNATNVFNLTTNRGWYLGSVNQGYTGSDFDASRVVPTSSENRPKNREIEIYKLKSINGIAV